MTWSGSTEMHLGSYSLGPPAQGMRSCSQAEKQTPASERLEVALLQTGVRKPEGTRLRGRSTSNRLCHVWIYLLGVSHLSRPRV